MEQKNTPTLQPTLEEVRDKLEHWRKIKRNHREPIPQNLWQATADLARKHSINKVSKALHLSYADLKNHVYGPSRPKSIMEEKTSAFIELECKQPFLASEVMIEMEDGKGSKMRICFKGKTDFDLPGLAKAFWQKDL